MSELIGYRCWGIQAMRTADISLVETSDGQLAIPYAIVLGSLNGTPWPGPVMHADDKPMRLNSNGIYCLKSQIAAREYTEAAPITGSVAMYGKVIEHDRGYRAEHVAMRSLTVHIWRLTEWVTKGDVARQISLLAHMLERRYDVEVLIDSANPPLHHREELINQFMSKVQAGTITADELAELAKLFSK